MTDTGLSIQTLGPAPAPFARLRGRYRYRLLVNADKPVNLQKFSKTGLAALKYPPPCACKSTLIRRVFFKRTCFKMF